MLYLRILQLTKQLQENKNKISICRILGDDDDCKREKNFITHTN